jgi:hypothetical protein
MQRRLLRILLILLLVPPMMATVMGWLVAPSFLHPVRRPLTPGLIREADASFAHSRAQREDFLVTRPTAPNFTAGRCARRSQTAPGCCSSTVWPTTAWARSGNPRFCCAPDTA